MSLRVFGCFALVELCATQAARCRQEPCGALRRKLNHSSFGDLSSGRQNRSAGSREERPLGVMPRRPFLSEQHAAHERELARTDFFAADRFGKLGSRTDGVSNPALLPYTRQ